MPKNRVNISLSPELVEALRETDLNRSEVAEAALWRAVNKDTLQLENIRLRKDVKYLKRKLNDIFDHALYIVEQLNPEPELEE